MNDRKPTLIRLKRADPRGYAEICEKAGCYGEALKYYSQRDFSEDIAHAAELALQSGRKKQVRSLCERALDAAGMELGRSEAATHGRTAGMGTGMSYVNTQDRVQKLQSKVSGLLGQLI